MKNRTKHLGRVASTHRLESSRNGNPRFRVVIEEYPLRIGDRPTYVTADTTPDSSLGYAIQNSVYSTDWHMFTIGTHYGKQSIDTVRTVDDSELPYGRI